jgi:integrase
MHQEGGRRVQKRRSNWDDVETHIEDVVAARRQNDPERLELTGRDRRIYLAALEAVKPLGREVDDVAREFAGVARLLAPHGIGATKAAQMLDDALKKLGKTSLSSAVDFYKRYGETMTASRMVREACDELLSELKKDGRGKYHIRDMKIRLDRFAGSFPGPIHEIREAAITEWLQSLSKTVWKDGERVENEKGESVSGRTRNNYRDAVSALFEFSRKRGYVPRDLPTEATGTVRMKVVSGKNHIITPEDAKRMLEKLPPSLIPYTVLKLFSGLRTEEAFGLNWEDLRFESNAVIIEARLAKLRQRRVPPILPNLAQWLSPFRGLSGAINPDYSSPQGVQKAVIRESGRMGVALRRNTFRNCYISYRVAQPTSPAIVAVEAGTSPRMIEANYKELATREEARRWFAICPKRTQVMELRKWAKNARMGANAAESAAKSNESPGSPSEICDTTIA